MILVELPLIDVRGEWEVTDRERALVRLLVPALPPAPPPGSDVQTRWTAATATLGTFWDRLREHRQALFEPGQAAIVTGPGKVCLLDLGFKGAGVLRAGGSWADRDALAGHLDRLEPEVAALRGYLAEAAGAA